MLAIGLIQEQGIEVAAIHFQTTFMCCGDRAGQAARELNVPLTVVPPEESYLDLVRKPRFGYGRGANPCVDCRIYMFTRAGKFMRHLGAQFVISGEVLGQRPMSQKRRDLEVIAHHSQLDDLLLRPLSAKRLPPTRPEREGLVERNRLYDFCGRSRQGIIALARQFGFRNIPSPSTGCALTEAGFARKVFDLVEFDPEGGKWDFELLRVGRHYRLDQQTPTKIIVGRNARENDQLRMAFERPDARRATLLEPYQFSGPTAMIVGPVADRTEEAAIGLMLRHCRNADPGVARIKLTCAGTVRLVPLAPVTPPEDVQNIAQTISSLFAPRTKRQRHVRGVNSTKTPCSRSEQPRSAKRT
jgi:hypothetical protein